MGKSKTSKKVKAEEPKKVEKVDKTKGKKAAKAEEEKKKQQKKKEEEKPTPMEVEEDSSSEESSSSDDSSSEEEVAPAKKAAPAKAAPAKKAAKKESSSEEESSSSDDSSSEEEEEVKKPAAKAAAKKEESEDSSSEEESSSDEEEEEKPAADNKRKRDEENGDSATNGDAEESNKKAKTEEAPATSNFFIGNLPWSADEDSVKQFFESQGVSVVHDVRLITDRETGRKKGFGYIEVPSSDADAVLALLGADFEGRELKVDRANDRPAASERAPRENNAPRQSGEAATDGNVFLGNLSFNSTEDSIWAALEQFGTVKAVRIVYDRETQKPRGFGYCEFEDAETANKAIAASGTVDVDGRQIRIDTAAASRTKPPRHRSLFSLSAISSRVGVAPPPPQSTASDAAMQGAPSTPTHAPSTPQNGVPQQQQQPGPPTGTPTGPGGVGPQGGTPGKQWHPTPHSIVQQHVDRYRNGEVTAEQLRASLARNFSPGFVDNVVAQCVSQKRPGPMPAGTEYLIHTVQRPPVPIAAIIEAQKNYNPGYDTTNTPKKADTQKEAQPAPQQTSPAVTVTPSPQPPATPLPTATPASSSSTPPPQPTASPTAAAAPPSQPTTSPTGAAALPSQWTTSPTTADAVREPALQRSTAPHWAPVHTIGLINKETSAKEESTAVPLPTTLYSFDELDSVELLRKADAHAKSLLSDRNWKLAREALRAARLTMTPDDKDPGLLGAACLLILLFNQGGSIDVEDLIVEHSASLGAALGTSLTKRNRDRLVQLRWLARRYYYDCRTSTDSCACCDVQQNCRGLPRRRAIPSP
jgi:nucleolin